MSETAQEFFLIIDGSSLLTTQYYGNLPKEILFSKTKEEKEKYNYKIMQTSKGVYTNAVFGFLRTLLRILKDQKPSYLAITWDVSRNTFRREMYADYKGNRGELPEPLLDQFILCQQILRDMNIMQFMDEYYEADDFSGSLAKKFEAQVPVRILTKDNDYLQLVTEHTNLWLMHGTAKKTEELYKKYGTSTNVIEAPDRAFSFTPELVKEEFGVPPEAISSLKGLQGDASDNIKGVPGVGEMTAVALIKEYGSIESLYHTILLLDEAGRKELAEHWKSLGIKRSPMTALTKTSEIELVGEKAAVLSKQLATIKTDIDLGELTLEQLSIRLNQEKTQERFDELEFKALKLEYKEEKENILKEANFTMTSELTTAERVFSEILNGAKKEKSFLGLSVAAKKEEVVGVSITYDSGCTYLFQVEGFLTKEYLKDKIYSLLEAGFGLAVIDLKRQLPFLGLSEEYRVFDLAIASYLLNPLANTYQYGDIAKNFLGICIPSAGELLGKVSVKEAAETLPEAFVQVCCYDSSVAFHCCHILQEQLKESGMTSVYEEIEMPLVYTLYEMECHGIKIQQEALAAYGQKLSVDIIRLEKEIYDEVSEKFNINSPKQLGVILFEKLKLPYEKKTKTGYSTSADVLERLQEEYPIVRKILEYRQLTKLKSTYADGLAEYVSEDGRIHGTFNQMVTATGRISSTEPNLQNIPVRMELGRLIRKVFVPEEGYLYLDADYSQIELRILAHMSGDERLIAAYRTAQDIHRITASEVFHTPLEEVTPALRSSAKAVNFGIVYGISSFSLGQDLNITKKEAEQYIKGYFETYPQVKVFLDRLVEMGNENGYVTTLFGRRRPIPELSSSNFMQRSFGERVAMNSPIQGTAADIIKIAMIRVNRKLKALGFRSKLLLQIHDELLVETLESEKEQVLALLQEEMLHAASLSVSLEVEIGVGSSWYDAK